MAFRQPAYGAGNFGDASLDPIRAQSDAEGFTLPAPVGGWNMRDPIAGMRGTDAIYLDNWFPTPAACIVRPGSVVGNTVPALTQNQLGTLLPFAGTDGAVKLFAASAGGIFDVTTQDGSLVAAPASSLCTTPQVRYTNFVNSGSTFLWCCDGVDVPFYYSSSGGWQSAVITGLGSPQDFTNVSIFNGRIILTKKGSLSFWYLGLQSIQGAATQFVLEPFFSKGGYLVATTSWTNMSTFGSQQYFIAISSQGELIIYAGTDPALAGSFQKVGTFFVGKPVGMRPFVTLGTDIGIMTVAGMIPLSKAMQAATIDRSAFYTDKIQPALSVYAKAMVGVPGWCATLFPAQNALLINVPIVPTFSPDSLSSWQVVMNTQTGAWCRFIGWNAQDICELDGKLYFCSGYTVSQAWTGTTDNGQGIICNAKQAFTKAGTENLKLPTMVRPLLQGNQNASFNVGIDMDFEDNLFTSGAPIVGSPSGIWDLSMWDKAVWADGSAVTKAWSGVNVSEPGQYFSLRLQVISSGVSLSWAATNFLMQVGGTFG